jgi:hypothetical protein
MSAILGKAAMLADSPLSSCAGDAEITTAVSFDVVAADNFKVGPRIAVDSGGDVVRQVAVGDNGRESVGSTLTAVGWAAEGPGISTLLAGLTASAGQ